MTITRTAIGLSDFSWAAKNKRYGPALRFTLTWIGTTDEGLRPGLSIPGFTARKNADGEVKIYSPLRQVNATSTYHSAQITTDMAEWILEELRKTNFFKVIGQNYKPQNLLDMPDDLTPELPAGITLY